MRFVHAAKEGRLPGIGGRLGIAAGAAGNNADIETALPGGYDLSVLANLDPPAAERVDQHVL